MKLLTKVGQKLILIEPLLLAVIIWAFWFVNPDRIWTLALIPIIFVMRLAAYGRLWTPTPLDLYLGLFVLLGLISAYTAPYSLPVAIPASLISPDLMIVRPWSAWYLLGRIIMGILVYISFIEYARRQGKMTALLVFSTFLALLVADLAIGETQWNEKSTQLLFIIRILPQFKGFPGAEGGFNANEIGGALAWMTPLMAGIAIYCWRAQLSRIMAAIASLAFGMLFLALFLGQSRLALGGVLFTLFALVFLLIPKGRWRFAALAALGLVIVLEILIVSNLLAPQESNVMLQRDEGSLEGRLSIWRSALEIVRDHPLTGVGMNMFRSQQVRNIYPAPGYDKLVLPHAHDEWLQVASDLGLPGLAVYLGWHILVGFMLIQSWRKGDLAAKSVAAAVGAGLVAHAVFGLGDAITLWDRFIFVYWWLFGLAGAQYALVHLQKSKTEDASDALPLPLFREPGHSQI